MDSPPSDDRGPGFKSALGWSYAMHGGQYIITTVITFVLAALLGPEVYGIVAMALVYIAFIEMLLKQGMLPAIVQRPDLQSSHLDSAFWLMVASATFLTVAGLLLADWWAAVNQTPDLAPVVRALSALIPLQALIVVQDAVLRRRMDFRNLAIRTNLGAIAGGAAGLTLALAGMGVWALVAQQIARAVVDVAVLWAVSDWRPGLNVSVRSTKELMSFSAPLAVASIGNFVNNRADALLIGLYFGPTAVGLYRLASRFVNLAVDITVRALQAVSLPELSRIQADRTGLQTTTLKIIRSTALLSLPALGLLAGASESLVDLLGPEWSAAAAPLRVLCIVGAIRALTMVIGPLLSAIGRPRTLAVFTWIAAGLSAASFVAAGVLLAEVSIATQVLGVATIRMALYATVLLIMSALLLLRILDIGPMELLKPIAPSAMAGLTGFAVAIALSSLPLETLSPVVRTAVVAGPALLLMAILLLRIEPTARRYFSQLFRRRKAEETPHLD